VNPIRVLLIVLAGLAAGCSGTEEPGTFCPRGEASRGPALAADRGYLLVADGLSEDWAAARIDTGGATPVGGRGLLGRAPSRLAARGREVLVVNSLDNAVQILDTATGITAGCIDIGRGTNPWDVCVDPADPSRAWVSTFLTGEIVEVDLDARRVLRRAVVEPGAEALLVTATRIAVTLTGYDGSTGEFGVGQVAVLDRATLAEIRRLDVPANPQHLFEGADGRVHVVCTGNYGNHDPETFGSVVRIESDWSVVRDTLDLGGSPARAAVAPDGTAYVAAFFGGLMTYDSAAFLPLRTAVNPLDPSAGWADVVTAGEYVHAVNFDLDAVAVIDPESGAIVGEFLVGDGPVAAVWLPPLDPASPGS
jgi:DNA-binding beta-propeller fold protein YncE